MNRSHTGILAVLLAVGAVAALLLSNNPGRASSEGHSVSVTLIVDRTVSDRDALVTETQQALDGLIQDMATNGASYLGGTIKMVYADDAGEHSSAWKVEVPRTFGVKKSSLKKAIAAVSERKTDTLNSLRNDSKAYQRSYLVESANRELELLTSDSKLIMISDMCAVDGSGNNFERLAFSTPPTLPRKGQVEIRRIGRKGQSLDAIKLIEAWWNDAFYGKNTFRPLYDSYLKKEEEKKAPPIKTTNRPPKGAKRSAVSKPSKLLKGIAKKPAPKTEPDEIEPVSATDLEEEEQISVAPASIWIINERKMVAMSGALRPCFARLPVGRYSFRIDVSSDGSVSNLESKDSAPASAVTCLKQRLSETSFARHPKNVAYYFDETVRIGSQSTN